MFGVVLAGDGDLVRTLLVQGLGDFSLGGDVLSGFLATGAEVGATYGAFPRTLSFLFSRKRASDAFLA